MANAHKKANDVSQSYYLNQKKALEFNPRHPVLKELLRRVEADTQDPKAKEIAEILLDTAILRSGYMLQETSKFADSIDRMMRATLNVNDEFEPDFEEFPEPGAKDDLTDNDNADEEEEIADGDIDHDEL